MSYIYVAQIDGRTDICKIGASQKPELRMKALCNEHGSMFVLFTKVKASNHFGSEKKIHEGLSQYSCAAPVGFSGNNHRELFSLSPMQASYLIEEILGSYADPSCKVVDFSGIVTDIIQHITYEALWVRLKAIIDGFDTSIDTIRRIANGSTTKVEYHIGCGLLEIHKGVLPRKCK